MRIRSAPASDAIWVASVICMPTLYVQLLRTGFIQRGAQLAEHALAHFIEGALQRKSAGAFMAAAAEGFGDGTHADVAFAAQAHPPPASFDLAEECGDFNARDAECVIHEAFAVFFQR